MSYVIISAVFIVLAFFLGVWANKKEIENNYIKPTLCITAKKHKGTGKSLALTFYYDKEYLEYEEKLFSREDANPDDEAEEEISKTPDEKDKDSVKEDAA